MSRGLLLTAAIAALSLGPGAAAQASAQDMSALTRPFDSSVAMADSVVAPVRLEAQGLDILAPRAVPELSRHRPGSSALMMSLYASTAALQMLDVHSTLSAFDHGATEGNPLMAGVAQNKVAFVAMKAGVAAGTILATHNMAKRNKVAAIATLVAINSAYAFVVHHNYKVAHGAR